MQSLLRRLATDYGMLAVLILLGVIFSGLTLEEQSATDAASARRVAQSIRRQVPEARRVLVAVRPTPEDGMLAESLGREIAAAGMEVAKVRPIRSPR